MLSGRGWRLVHFFILAQSPPNIRPEFLRHKRGCIIANRRPPHARCVRQRLIGVGMIGIGRNSSRDRRAENLRTIECFIPGISPGHKNSADSVSSPAPESTLPRLIEPWILAIRFFDAKLISKNSLKFEMRGRSVIDICE